VSEKEWYAWFVSSATWAQPLINAEITVSWDSQRAKSGPAGAWRYTVSGMVRFAVTKYPSSGRTVKTKMHIARSDHVLSGLDYGENAFEVIMSVLRI
jgi:hypothetical protein